MAGELHFGDQLDAFFKKVQEIGGLAMMLEMKLRILAGKNRATRSAALAHNVQVTERAVVDHYRASGHLSDDEIKVLEQARSFRNKLFHAEFKRAMKVLEGYRRRPFPPSRWLVGSISDTDPHDPIRVTDAKGKRDTIMGRVFYFMEVGALDEAEKLEQQAHGIVSRLFRIDIPPDSVATGF